MDLGERAAQHLSRWLAERHEVPTGELTDDEIASMTRLVQAIGPLDWEIGPADDRQRFFAVSPRGRREALGDLDRLASVRK